MITKGTGIPKYLQLKTLLKEKIDSSYRPGDKFMTEQEIMQVYQVSCATVAHAMKELTAEGYFFRKRGGGSFVQAQALSNSDGNLQNVPELFLNGHGVCSDRSNDPFNWFIKSEVSRGIINHFSGKIKILDDNELIDGIRNGRIKNVILTDPRRELLETTLMYQCHYVLIDQNNYYNGTPNRVCWEQLTGVYELMSHLIQDFGHRRIGFIYGKGRYHYDRFAGYQIGLRTHELPFDEKMAIAIFSAENSVQEATEQLLTLPKPPTAIFVDTDIKAIAAIAAIRKHNLRVPEDISIAGFDDIPGADELDPPLTTVKAPYYDMGRVGVKMLMNILDNGTNAQSSEILHTRLVIRKSCAKIK